MKKEIAGELPFRSELFNAVEIKEYARSIAGTHHQRGMRRDCDMASLFRRLSHNERALLDAHARLEELIGKDNPAPAVEWFLNNFHLILDQVRRAPQKLPKGHSKNLFSLASGPQNGIPRIYDMATGIISHSDGEINQENLKAFLLSYQTVSILSHSELQSVHLVLRLALIENIRRLILPMTVAAAARNKTGEELTAGYLCLKNNVISLRILSAIDWHEFIDTVSLIEQVLRKDPGAAYIKMDYYARNDYRKAVEKIAANCGRSEEEIAGVVLQLSEESAARRPSDNHRTIHVGFYLVGAGREDLEKKMGARLPVKEWAERKIRRRPAVVYTGLIILLTCLISGIMIGINAGGRNPLLTLLVVLSLLCASQVSVTLVNLLMKFLVEPRLLPRMDFSTGIPREFRSLVVIPAILTEEKEIESLVHDLEVRFLANRDKYLHFGLLTDLQDANEQVVPGDDRLLQLLQKKISSLNMKYRHYSNTGFFLFHRPRRWNAAGNTWMGYERKRGKLMELNALLRKNATEYFSLIIGDQSVFPKIRYVITLDRDTRLPIGAARKLIGTMAHPLNQAVYCEQQLKVTEGYGILQPRVGVYFSGSTSSFYTHLNEMGSGIDPYTRATTDVYQDLFNEGSYIGKGIYDVDVVMKTLWDRLPENRILSHDLLEGCYTRCGLLSDVRLYEAHPAGYLEDMDRRHRWTRGDWQICPWLFPFVPGPGGKRQVNPLSALSRWKILDNLRRSLMPPTFLLLLIAGWTPFGHAAFFTASVILAMTLSCWNELAENILGNPKNIGRWTHWKNALQVSSKSFLQAFHALITLPYEAYYTTHAILCAGWRLTVSPAKLLEWNSSDSRARQSAPGLAGTYRRMWVALLISLSVSACLILFSPSVIPLAGPILFLWAASPAFTWWLSGSAAGQEEELTDQQRNFLRRLARRTWFFFEKFISADDNWLPPDHYQEYPVEKIAHYTSPTNIGLGLLANLSAWDFGYLTTGEFIEKTSLTIHSMSLLERYKGHFYNWYDTLSLMPSAPRYVSTVDSGNLAGHLFTLRQGILAMPEQKIISPAIFCGLQDTLSLLEEEEGGSFLAGPFKKELHSAMQEKIPSLPKIRKVVDRLIGFTERMLAHFQSSPGREILPLVQLLDGQCRNIRRELMLLAPWLLLKPAPKKFRDLGPPDAIPDLPGLLTMVKDLLQDIGHLTDADNSPAEREWLHQWKDCLLRSAGIATDRLETLERLADACARFADMEYDFLYDKPFHQLAIGYNADTGCRDTWNYDLLASEARLASFVAIAQGKLPLENWFALGRSFVDGGRTPLLVSWTGTLFEYLMPMLVMPNYENTLLDLAYKGIVRKQMEFGKDNGMPWGISECCYNVVDADLNYQYRACGLREVSLKYRTEDDLVVAPYASALALMVAPRKACQNLERLASGGARGRFGFFEAIDYSLCRLSGSPTGTAVRSFMVHHQGMSLLSLAYVLSDKPMQKRFTADPQLQACLLLLQERMPKEIEYCLPNIVRADHFMSKEISSIQ